MMIARRLPSQVQPILAIARTFLLSSLMFYVTFALVGQSQAFARQYALRLGIFRRPENARSMAQHFERLGLEVVVKEGSIKGLGKVSMVYLGYFESIKAAERVAEDLVARGLITEYVIKILPPEEPSPPPKTFVVPPRDRTEKEEPLVITDITFELEKGSKERVLIHGNRRFTPTVFGLEEDPPRLVVDIRGVSRFAKRVSNIPVDGEFIRQIRINLHQGSQTMRVVLDHYPSPERYEVGQIFYEDENIFALEVTRRREDAPSEPLADKEGDAAPRGDDVADGKAELLATTPDRDAAETNSGVSEESTTAAVETRADEGPPPATSTRDTVTHKADSPTATPDDEAGRVDFTEPALDFGIAVDTPAQEQEIESATPAAEDSGQVRLRAKGMNLRPEDVHAMLVGHNFYSSCFDFNTTFCHPAGNFANAFVDNGDETVTDHATKLMWQRGGSPEPLSWLDAKAYVEELNRLEFAGHADWRLPTAEELASTIEVSWKNGDLYVSTVFDNRLRGCWSTDTRGPQRAWKAAFHLGIIIDEPMTYVNGVRAVRSL